MANLRQDRVSGPTLSFASKPEPEGSVNGRAAASRNVMLSVRLCTQDSSASPADVSWAGDSPAAALVLDVLSASEGAPDPPQGPVLTARFFNLQSALLAGRRLQWAVQGLVESTGSQGIAAGMAIHSAGEIAATSAPFDKMAPGQVVVESSMADAVRQLPGATLRETGDGRWTELLWRSSGPSPGFSADEQSVLGLIHALGREDPCPTVAEPPQPSTGTTAAPVTGAFHTSEALGRSSLEPEPGSVFARFKWLILGGAAAVVLLLAVLLIPRIVSGNHAKAPAQGQDTSGKTTGPVPTATPVTIPTQTAAPEKPAKQPAKSGKQIRAESPAQKPAATGPCDLTEAEIPRSLSRAESYMYAGKLEEAQAMYQRVLPCPSAHEKAVEGLQHIRQRMAAQSP